MRIALTGHRPQRLGLPEDETDNAWEKIEEWITKQLFEMNEVSYLNGENLDVYCGMASGSDFVFGTVAVLAKIDRIIPLTLHCILPCKNYNSSHPFYKDIKKYADEWMELSDEFYKGCDNVRDQYMVDHCDVLLAIWDGNKSGGVWSTIRKAEKAGKKIVFCPKEVIIHDRNYSS